VVAALQEANARLRAENAELKAHIAEQAEKIARLERLISRNSGNSSMPPSTDDLPGKTPPQRSAGQGGMKRKPGKQPGAPGAFLAWNEHPDTTEDVFPEGTCPCGADLAKARDLGVRYSHQVTDLPQARAVTVQHDRHEPMSRASRRRRRARRAR
jgi:transposase